MSTETERPPTEPHARSALGIFQLLGLGLIAMILLFVLIVIVRSLLGSS